MRKIALGTRLLLSKHSYGYRFLNLCYARAISSVFICWTLDEARFLKKKKKKKEKKKAGLNLDPTALNQAQNEVFLPFP